MHRAGANVCFAWDNEHQGEGVVFHAMRGTAWATAREFEAVVYNFVDWVADQIGLLDDPVCRRDHGELQGWLQRVADKASSAEHMLVRYLGMARATVDGLLSRTQTASLTDLLGFDSAWVREGAAADPTLSPLLCVFRCVSPTLSVDDLMALHALVVSRLAGQGGGDALRRLAGDVDRPSFGARDFDQGYAVATSLRALVGNNDRYLDVETLLASLGVSVADVALSDPSLDGGAVWGEGAAPVVFVNTGSRRASTAWGRRMVLAHELCHLIVDKRAAVPLALMSGAWAPPELERRPNAFAAELLVPAAGIRKELGVARFDWHDEHVQHLMSTFGAGHTVVGWQLENRAVVAGGV